MSYSESDLEKIWNSLDIPWKQGAIDHADQTSGIIVTDESYPEILERIKTWDDVKKGVFKNYIIWAARSVPKQLYVKDGNKFINMYYR